MREERWSPPGTDWYTFTRASREFGSIAGAKKRIRRRILAARARRRVDFRGGVLRRWMCRCTERDQWTSSITLNPLDGLPIASVRLTASRSNNQNRYSFSKSAIFPVRHKSNTADLSVIGKVEDPKPTCVISRPPLTLRNSRYTCYGCPRS